MAGQNGHTVGGGTLGRENEPASLAGSACGVLQLIELALMQSSLPIIYCLQAPHTTHTQVHSPTHLPRPDRAGRSAVWHSARRR